MILTRVVKVQLCAFLVISAMALSMIAFNYLGVRQALGVGRYSIAVELSDGSGLHESTVVTYRGAPIGKVADIGLAGRGVRAKLDLDTDARIPRSTRVEVHSASAAGEQHVDFVPDSSGPPFLHDGAVVTADRVTTLQSTGELVDSLTRLASSVNPEDVETVLRELATGLDGSADDWRELVASSLTITDGLEQNLTATTGLLQGLAKFLRTQDRALPNLTASARDLRSVTQTLRSSQPEFASILDEGGETLDGVSAMVGENAGDLGILVRDLASTGQVVKTYLPGVQQTLLIYPAAISSLIAATMPENGAEAGSVHLGFRTNVNEPPHCTDGFLPIKDQRAYGDYTTRLPMRADLYCQVPPDDRRAVRGARNFQCFNAPGRRAASVEQCLGRPIGGLDHPLRPSQRVEVGTYRSDTSRVLTSQGKTFLLGQSFGTGGKGGTPSWKSLVLP